MGLSFIVEQGWGWWAVGGGGGGQRSRIQGSDTAQMTSLLLRMAQHSTMLKIIPMIMTPAMPMPT